MAGLSASPSAPSRRRFSAFVGSFFSFGYLTLGYVFILLPVAVLVLFSFQDGALPVPPSRVRRLRGTRAPSPTTA